MFQWARNLFRTAPPAPKQASPATQLRARYESAQTTNENQPLWGLTDYLSPKAANSFQVRRTLKIRSRYEAANNSYFRGIIDTLANDLVGTGPRLQVRHKDPQVNKSIETAWNHWAKAAGLAEKLRTMAKAKVQDGEGFALAVTNKEIEDPVQLDWNLIEADQVTTPDAGFVNLFWVDGIVLNKLGNPVEYHVLRHHPGDLFVPMLNPLIYDRWPAKDVLHWFKGDRPGQVRGIPEITPALDLFAQLRRYTKAVIAAAETAADIAALLESEAAADSDGSDAEPFTQAPIDRGVMVTLPAGYKMSQLKAEQPATTYEMFVRLILREICRCLQIPINIAMGDSSAFNYSSGRLDHLGYHRGHGVSRSECEAKILAKIFRCWYAEARLVPDLLLPGLPELATAHRWFWDTAESIDPEKDANAEQIQLQGQTTTLAEIFAGQGKDWEEEIRQRGREIALCEELGIPVETSRKTLDEEKDKERKEARQGSGARGQGSGEETNANGEVLPLGRGRFRRGPAPRMRV